MCEVSKGMPSIFAAVISIPKAPAGLYVIAVLFVTMLASAAMPPPKE